MTRLEREKRHLRGLSGDDEGADVSRERRRSRLRHEWARRLPMEVGDTRETARGREVRVELREGCWALQRQAAE